jgi:uncharacterized protein (DUF1330 family)
MTAIMIARITPKDPGKLQDYLAKTKEIAANFGAEMVHRARASRTLNGSDDHQIVVIARFPTLEALESWYDSDAYQPLKMLRDDAADMHMTAYTVLD